MPVTPSPSLVPDPLTTWRIWLLDRVIGITLLACIIPCSLVTVEAWRGGHWVHAGVCWASLGVLAALRLRSRVSHALRATGSGLLLYGFGVWLLARGAAVGMLYLLTFPVMLALVLDTRAAITSLIAATLTLSAGGWLLELPIPMVVGLPGDNWLRWVTIGSNLLWLGVLLTLATGFLLRQLERTLASQRDSASLLRDVASQVPGMVFRLRIEGRVRPRFVYISPGSQDVLELSPESLLADAGALADRLHPDDLQAVLARTQAAIDAGRTHHEAQLRVRRRDGELRWVEVQASEVAREGDAVVLNGVVTDVTERQVAEAQVQQQARTDTLTGLPNRLSMQLELARLLAKARLGGDPVAVLLVDLDRFKEVNDTRGHAGGDALLVEAGRRLCQGVGPEGFVARVGGDEFVLLLTGPDSAVRAARAADQVLTEMARGFTVGGQQAFVSASVGIALHPDDGPDADELLIRADQALYEAKATGRNRSLRFTAELHARSQRRVRLAQDLRSAIDQNQLSLVYQPIVDLADGRVLKTEALLRWQHPELGAISPAEFVPIAESAGLIDGIGDWVFAAAVRQVRLWRQTLDPAMRVSINHSPLQFRHGAAAGVPWPRRLAALGVPGEALIVEITEGLLLDHSDALAEQLRELRACGVQIALDDFGTGYSALAYLHRYELDILKIDRSFVSGAAAGHTGRSLCRAMVALSQELGMQVVAEGVETAEQRDWLHSIGVGHAQGWFYGRGMPPAEFEAWFARHQEALTEPA